jgi:hypothetical protein
MTQEDGGELLDPFLDLSLPSPALSLCFVGNKRGGGGKFWTTTTTTTTRPPLEDNDENDSSDDESDSSSEELTFRSSTLQTRADAPPQARNYRRRQDLLKDRWIVSCHKEGEALLWDCARQTRIASVQRHTHHRQGGGLAVKRIDDTSDDDESSDGNHDGFFLYQTRDPKGTVSVHSLGRLGASGEMMKNDSSSSSSVVREYETYSATFCQAAPCRGNSHLIALPSRQESTATVVDDRDRIPIYQTTPAVNHHHGMVTSLAISMTGSGGRPILACGMESGSVVFHDFVSGRSVKGDCKLTKDPVLALDLAPSEISSSPSSSSTAPSSSSSVIAVAGLAGDALEVSELPEEERGRVALLKATIPTTISSEGSDSPSSAASSWNIQTRARLSTCRVVDEHDTASASFGKPGVAICRFRPEDARVFAVGGWDNRVRLFERSKGRPVGILRGHSGSVNALDWAPDAATSGLLATAGGEDGKISFWECFPKK